MNRILLLISICSISFLPAAAQTKTTKQLLLDTICNCISSKKEALKNATAEDLQKEVQMCFLSNGLDLMLQYAKEQNVDFSDEDAMQKIGMDLGLELLKSCPAFMELSMNMGMPKKDKPDSINEKSSNEKPAKIDLTEYTTGTVIKLNTTSFPASLEVKQKNGIIKKAYLVSEYIAQDNKFSNAGNLIGKKVELQTQQQKIFNPTSKKFETFDVLLMITNPSQ